jgi:thymidine phosphorylase
MNEVLGRTAGNALEVLESIDILKHGTGDARLIAVTLALAGEMLHLGGLASSPEAGRSQARHALESGAAAERFQRMVADLGGPTDLLDSPDRYLEAAPVTIAVRAHDDGEVTEIDVRRVGLAVVGLGGGRTRTDQSIDPVVGLSDVAGLGAAVGPGGRILAMVHARDQEHGKRAAEEIRRAFTIGAQAEAGHRLITARISP